ncbi:MAG: hypothetical protein ACKOW0_00700 [Schleiferiaceae bacterium]
MNSLKQRSLGHVKANRATGREQLVRVNIEYLDIRISAPNTNAKAPVSIVVRLDDTPIR